MNTEFLNDWRVWVALGFITVISFAAYFPFSSIGYAGGGEVTASYSYLSVDAFERFPYGQHYVNDWDIDGSFNDYTWNTTTGNAITDAILGYQPNTVTPDIIKKPGLTVESGNPYYLEEIGGVYVVVEDNVISKTYEKEFSDGIITRYNLMLFGMDVTMKTKADVFFKDPAVFSYFSDYGYDFESKKIEVVLRETFNIAPWSPNGVFNESYTIVGGFAGVMDSEIYEVSYGLVESGATENFNHIVTNIQSVGSTPNMYQLSSDNPITRVAFEDESALVNMPTAVDIELSATLQAGAQYHVDALGHWDSVAARNVFVKYRLVVRVVATLDMEFVTEANVLEDPDEENTFYKPQVPFVSDLQEAWNELWADVGEFFNSPVGLLMIVAVVLVGGLVFYMLIRLRGG